MKESGGWNLHYIFRDYLGSITQVTNTSGTLEQEVGYDAWGRLRNASTLEPYAPDSEPELFLGRGYTGHEHLTMFGLVNMNARLYDPAAGRFLNPDPYVQMADFSQSYNRFSYAMNNPLRYTDITGEYFLIDDLIAGLIGGTINLSINLVQGNVTSIWHGAALFGSGFAGGVVTIYVGPVAGAAVMSFGNSILNQGFTNGWNNTDLGQSAMAGIMGGATAFLGGQLGDLLSQSISNLTANIASPALREALTQSILDATTGFTLATGMAKLNGASWEEALSEGGDAALMGAGIGVMTGTVAGVKYAEKNNLNPWTGKSRTDVTAKDLGLSGTMERIKSGESYPHRNDGGIFENNKNILPTHEENYYREYVHPTHGIKGPGTQRIVIGRRGESYYTPDHYKTFIKFKY